MVPLPHSYVRTELVVDAGDADQLGSCFPCEGAASSTPAFVSDAVARGQHEARRAPVAGVAARLGRQPRDRVLRALADGRAAGGVD